MYKVELVLNNQIYPIHNEYSKLISGSVKQGINSINSFSFAIDPTNIGFGKIEDLKTFVNVFNTQRNRYEFQGRVLYCSDSMGTSGNISKEIVCESLLGFLQDSTQTYVYEQNWTPTELLTQLLAVHNSQLEDYKHFQVGTVELTGNIYVGIQRETTWQCIQDKIIDKVGGEIQLRIVDGVMYIDLLGKIGGTRATSIELGKNMMSITKDSDPTSYITRLIPLGAKLSDDGEERVDITTVNDGIDYIEDVTVKEEYGIKVAYEIWDDVHEPQILKTKATNFLIENNRVLQKFKIEALDLAKIGIDIDYIDVFDYYPVKNQLLGIDDTLRVIVKTIDIVDAAGTNIEVGDKLKTLSDLEIEKNKLLSEAVGSVTTIKTTTNKLSSRVENAEDKVSELTEITINQSTSILNDCNEIIMQALEGYVQTGTFGEYKETVASQFEVLAQGISLVFSTITEQITNVENDLQSQINTVTQYFTFDVNGMTIGRVDNPYKIVISNDRYSMLVNGVEIMWIANGETHTPKLTVTERMTLLGYIAERDSNGLVNWNYIY